MQVITKFVQDQAGNLMPNATGTLYYADTDQLVTGLQDIEGNALANPMRSDARGMLQFSAPTGNYDLNVRKGSSTYTVRVQVIDVDEAQQAAASATASSDSARAYAEAANDSAVSIKVVTEGVYSPEMFGSVADGETDDSDAIEAAASLGDTVLGGGTYLVDRSITLYNELSFRQGSRIKTSPGVNVHLVGGYLAKDGQHVFDISEGGSVTGDTAALGYTTPQHWGAKADGLTDDLDAIHASIRYAALNTSDIAGSYAEGIPVKFPTTDESYFLRSTAYVNRTTRIYAERAPYGRTQGGVYLKIADGNSAAMAVVAHFDDQGIDYSGANSEIIGLLARPVSNFGSRQGFVHNTPCHFSYCHAVGFEEVGFHAHGNTSGLSDNLFDHPGRTNQYNTEVNGQAVIGYNGTGSCYGNVNGSTYNKCAAPNNGLHGFVCHGNNAGHVKHYNCDSTNNVGAGFLDNTTIGSEYFGCHTSRNTFRVNHNDTIYMCIKAHTSTDASEPGVGSDWRRYWAIPNATAYEEEWAVGVDYFRPSGGYHSTNDAAQSTISGCYTEGGIEMGVVARDGTTVVGGSAAVRTFRHTEYGDAKVLGPGESTHYSQKKFIGQSDMDDDSTAYGVSIGTFSSSNGVLMELGDGRDDPDDPYSAMAFSWSPIRNRYQWVDSSNVNRPIYGMSGAGFTGTGFTSDPQAYFWANGMYLADGTAAGLRTVRLRAAYSASLISGEALKGDMWIHSNMVAGGKAGSVCTVSGTVGSTAVIKEFGAIDS